MRTRLRTVSRRVARTPLWRVVFGRVLEKHCPQCGGGALFSRPFRLHERCSACGLVYRREPGAELGSMYLGTTVTQIFGALFVLGVFFGTSWSPATGLAVGLPLVAAFCYAFQPYSMALWVGVEYLHDVGNHEWWARPRR
jgi:uncharacterized protein (DUF983 family)